MPPANRGSTFVVVLWITLGLVSLTLYFAHSMSFELRASDNRFCGTAAEQAIEGAARYVGLVLATLQTNGFVPEPGTYAAEAVPVGDSHFWLIGRQTNSQTMLGEVVFGLVDEASKINLNSAPSNILVFLPQMTVELTTAILDWRATNGGSGTFDTYYGMLHPPYQNKGAPFETVEELRLLYGADMRVLEGEDRNRNGVLDVNEYDETRNGVCDPGLLEYLTVYSREPNTYSNGMARVDISTVGPNGPLQTLLESALGRSKADRIMTDLGVNAGGGPGRPGPTQRQFRSPLEFYRASRMSAEDFALITEAITVAKGAYIPGRVNVNTAPADVLACLPGLSSSTDLAETLVTYRQSNPSRLDSIAWVVEALGQNNSSALQALESRDCITTRSFQFSADIAALGPHGRGYKRERFVFDTADGAPKIVYRQDLTHLGWALGKQVRQTWLFASQTP